MILKHLVKKIFTSYGNQNCAPVITRAATGTYPSPFEIQSILFYWGRGGGCISTRNIVLASVPQSPSLLFIY